MANIIMLFAPRRQQRQGLVLELAPYVARLASYAARLAPYAARLASYGAWQAASMLCRRESGRQLRDYVQQSERDARGGRASNAGA